ncbi:DUF2283 domain-containing protein [Candidatus Peregrinibacteria bacterium]|nr:DUF2283 domain-containing protein [Candidatus Peregrinibacteria bacterium]
MRVKYDPDVDALYITLKGHGVEHTMRIGPDIALDYGPDGEIHGIEILSAKEHLGKALRKITVENLKVAAS